MMNEQPPYLPDDRSERRFSDRELEQFRRRAKSGLLGGWTFTADRPIGDQWATVWPGNSSDTPSYPTHEVAETFAVREDCAVMDGDANGHRVTCFDDCYQPSEDERLRVQASTALEGDVETDGSEGWYAWAIRWPQQFSTWEGLGFSASSYHVTHPGYGMHGWRSPSAGQYALQIKAGHTPSPAGSGTPDSYGQNGISDYNPITPGNAPAGVSNPNGISLEPVLLGPGGRKPLELNVWQFIIEHVVWRAMEPGLLEIFHAVPGDEDFEQLYRGEHATLAWNEKYGVTLVHLGFQVYRGAPAPTVAHDLAGIRRVGSLDEARMLFGYGVDPEPAPEPEPDDDARSAQVSIDATITVDPVDE